MIDSRTAHQRRWPASVAVIVIILLEFGLPDQIVPPWWPVLFAFEVLLLVPLVATNPIRLTRDQTWIRYVGISLALLLLAGNAARLGQLLFVLFDKRALSAVELLSAGLLIWVTNVVATAIAYWELDRGGPFARDPRHERAMGAIDLLFPQLTGVPGVDPERWRPSFLDYLFVAFTAATAFSPTDVLPLTGRAKLLMMTASTVSLVTVAGVAARAVNVL
ncbi:hypothetical protein [Labedaea rhizosphaerae]|uniref:DUF1345 domain-containing protein n=1 Tax=Labedaea rhizosphaerae TaxID=598644 RepID=A0A4R6SBU0_LABRH|nr:hypothetical protein [Labedaea rhizosphaerae]TDP97410.1 hypothetical protein EV186_103374 [Labedaea rhizosphaerae]